ncbi:TadE family type IV pilus minor pilin [Nocardioides sp.]|uniref:TadE family type IV pilus minor pilin n=1 Tax=Nocardioides sp. TaxID=35761 RepID=UPI002ED56664
MTAELALGLPLLLAVTVGLVWLLAVGAAQVRVVDGAREAARALARGDAEGSAFARAAEVAGPGSRVAASYGDGRVSVTVDRRVSGPGGLFDAWPEVGLHAEAVAAAEAP